MDNKPNEINSNTNNRFLLFYSFLLILVNFFGFLWAIEPQSFGGYIGLFFVPINGLFLLSGFSIVIYFLAKKKTLNYLLYFSTVILLPVVMQILLFFLIETFARKGGC